MFLNRECNEVIFEWLRSEGFDYKDINTSLYEYLKVEHPDGGISDKLNKWKGLI